MIFDAAIFDMDGTLVDSLDVWENADAKFLEKMGICYDSVLNVKMKTLHFISACELLKDYFNLESSIDEIASQIMEIVREDYETGIPLKAGVLEYLNFLEKRNVKMCVATANVKSLAEACLKALNIYDKFEFVITADEVGVGKENPLVFETAAKKLGVLPENTVVIEDSYHAICSAKSAGFKTIGVHDKKYEKDFEKIKEVADTAVFSLAELIE